MREVVVKTDELLDIIRTNRDLHKTIFEEAIVGYRDRVIKELDRRLEDVKAGKPISLTFRLAEPEDHTIDYDRVIKMLEMEVNEEVEIDAASFTQYVMDDWSWKRAWVENSSLYSVTAASTYNNG